MATHSWSNPNSGLPLQRLINRKFVFKPGEIAKCKIHGIARCQHCTNTAISDEKLIPSSSLRSALKDLSHQPIFP